MPQYSLNTAKVGVKHQSINQSINRPNHPVHVYRIWILTFIGYLFVDKTFFSVTSFY